MDRENVQLQIDSLPLATNIGNIWTGASATNSL